MPGRFLGSADGTLQFDMKDGSLPHVSLGEDTGAACKFTRFTGQARLHSGTIEMKDASLDSPDGKFRVERNRIVEGRTRFQAGQDSE